MDEKTKEALRLQLQGLMQDMDFPLIVAQEIIGCTRTTLHNWLENKPITDDYLTNIQSFIEVLQICSALGVFPIVDGKRKTVYSKFYTAMATLKLHLSGK